MFSQYHDPLHLLLDYIAEVCSTGIGVLSLLPTTRPILTWTLQQATDCDMVVVHDDDLVTIDGLGHGAVSEPMNTSRIVHLFK